MEAENKEEPREYFGYRREILDRNANDPELQQIFIETFKQQDKNNNNMMDPLEEHAVKTELIELRKFKKAAEEQAAKKQADEQQKKEDEEYYAKMDPYSRKLALAINKQLGSGAER